MMRAGGEFFLEIKSRAQERRFYFFFIYFRRRYRMSGVIFVPFDNKNASARPQNAGNFAYDRVLVLDLEKYVGDKHLIYPPVFYAGASRCFKVRARRLNVEKMKKFGFGARCFKRFRPDIQRVNFAVLSHFLAQRYGKKTRPAAKIGDPLARPDVPLLQRRIWI